MFEKRRVYFLCQLWITLLYRWAYSVPDRKRVEVKDLKSGKIYEEEYDKLVLILGSRTDIASLGRNLEGVDLNHATQPETYFLKG